MGRILSVVILITAFVLGLLFVSSKNSLLESPVGKVYGTNKVEITNDWFPKTDSGSKNIPFPFELTARSAFAVDFTNGNVIFEKNSKNKLAVGSTVKIMTALVVLENTKPDAVFTVSANAAKVGENSMGLTEGEKLTVEELLYGLMLVSGNDAAVTLAEGVAGTESEFANLMNQKVQSLGLEDSKFINASGLDEDGKTQYSTAYDLSVMAHYVWENYEIFRKISGTSHIFIDGNPTHKPFDLYNDTNLLTTYPGVKGIKPGFTWEAGLCLVTYSENEGKKVLAVILGSDDRRSEMVKILDSSFSNFGITIFHPQII